VINVRYMLKSQNDYQINLEEEIILNTKKVARFVTKNTGKLEIQTRGEFLSYYTRTNTRSVSISLLELKP
jgi:hypothetical protein